MAETTNGGDNGPPPLFHEVCFHIVECETLNHEKAREIADVLSKNGATEATGISSYYPEINFNLEEVTHIISSTINFPGYVEAEGAMVPIVRPDWVYASLEKNKLAHVRPHTPDPRLFFSGVVITTADLPEGDKEAIYGGVLALGGQYSNNLTKLVTHVVALSAEGQKWEQAKAKRYKVKFVLPHWFDDCLKLNRRIDESPYLLPNPEILTKSASEQIAVIPTDELKLTYGKDLDIPPRVRDEDFQVFDGKKFFVSPDLGINSRLRDSIYSVIREGGGEITNVLDEATAYVGQFRSGSDYKKASRKGIVVGNLLWLYWMIAHNKWASPLERLLHYPIVKGGIRGMDNAIISVSNYGGDARLYLEHLIEVSGARFTKSMKTENTHLITARAHSDKCNAAREWNIHMINHLWLEETYAKWEVQSVSNPRYTHFPPRTNLSEVVGKTPIDQKVIRQFWDDDSDDEEEDSDEEMPDAGEDEPTAQFKGASSKDLQTPRHADSKEMATVPLTERRHTTNGLATPGGRTTTGESTVSTPASKASSRRAKEKATSRLSESIMDMNLYEKEKKRKGGVLGTGRKRKSSISELERSFSEPKTADESEGEQPKKKAKNRIKPTVKLLITGYSGWTTQAKEEKDKRRLLDLGIECVDDPAQCTHMAAPKLVRTAKFVCALARAPVIVRTEWFEDCIKEGNVLDTESYELRDTAGEARLKINLKDSLERAKKNSGKLLEDQTIYIAPEVTAGFDTCKRIVEANGGVCVLFKGKRIVNANTPQGPKSVLISSENAGDKKYWKQFTNMAKSTESQPYIYSMDWLLNLAMTQKVVWGSEYLVADVKE